MSSHSPRSSDNSLDNADRTAIPGTYALLAIIIIIFIIMYKQGNGQITDAVALRWGVEMPQEIRRGAWWLLFTPIFLHGSIEHIAFNGWSLYILGNYIERFYGTRRMFIIFIITGVIGNWISAILMPHTPSLGASGAIFGLVGAGLIFPIQWKSLLVEKARQSLLRQLLFVTVLNIAFSFMPGIDKWAHFGGLASGALIALCFAPIRILPKKESKAAATMVNSLAVLLLVVTLAAGIIQAKGTTVTRSVRVQLGNSRISFSLPDGWHAAQANGTQPTWTDDNGHVLIVMNTRLPASSLPSVTPQMLGVTTLTHIKVLNHQAISLKKQQGSIVQYICIFQNGGTTADSVELLSNAKREASDPSLFKSILQSIKQ